VRAQKLFRTVRAQMQAGQRSMVVQHVCAACFKSSSDTWTVTQVTAPYGTKV